MKIEEYFNHNDLIDFYISRGVEFGEDKNYPHPPLFSYIAKVSDEFLLVRLLFVKKTKITY